jgi:hypothetical protein
MTANALNVIRLAAWRNRWLAEHERSGAPRIVHTDHAPFNAGARPMPEYPLWQDRPTLNERDQH